MERGKPDGDRLCFLKYEFLTASISAAFQRNRLYGRSSTAKQRADFRRELRERLEELVQKYTTHVSDTQHEANIEDLSKVLSGRAFLRGDKFRIGTCQKAINLYLKYLWCVGAIPEPPHCPFDGRVLKALGSHVNWTELDSIEVYRGLVKAAREQAMRDGVSIPVWELKHFNAWRL